MLEKLCPRSVYDVMAAIACFGVLAGGTAYAANTVGSPDVIDESLLSQDLKNGDVKGPDLGNNSVSSAKISPGQVLNADVGPNAVTGDKVADDALLSQHVKDDNLTGADIDEATLGPIPNADRLDGIDSTAFLQTVSVFGGDVSGPFSNLQIAANAIGSGEVLDGSLTFSDLGTNSVSSTEVAPEALLAADLHSDSVGSSEIAPNAVDFSEMDSDSVGVAEIRAASVGFSEMLSNSVGTNEVINGDLDAVDVGKASGRATLDFGSIPGHDCGTLGIDAGVNVDGDAVFATPNTSFPISLSHSERDSIAANHFAVVVCNPGNSAVNPPATVFSYVVFDN